MKKFILAAFLIATMICGLASVDEVMAQSAAPNSSQVPQLQWGKTYYGDSGSVIQTTDGGYAIAANNASIGFYPAWQRAPMLIKTDITGNL